MRRVSVLRRKFRLPHSRSVLSLAACALGTAAGTAIGVGFSAPLAVALPTAAASAASAAALLHLVWVARASRELERQRREQATARRAEREALIETLSAEIAHEVRYPINYFRMLFERTSRGQPLEVEDVDIGREEVERLERLVVSLRGRKRRGRVRSVVRLADVCARAEALVRDLPGERKVELAVPRDAAVRCDRDQITQVLVNLLSNALQAATPDGRVGVEWHRESDGSAQLTVWDTGPGFALDPRHLFSAWHTTKEHGTGLGLPITHRLLRVHGWSIRPERKDGRTRFVVTIPAEAILRVEGRAATETRREPA